MQALGCVVPAAEAAVSFSWSPPGRELALRWWCHGIVWAAFMYLARFLHPLWRALRRFGASAVDALPPYRKVEGRLAAKERGPEGTYHILVDSEIIEVDWLTFETLIVGEALRVRYTRSQQAINIDRLVP
jgi:hypothetical protein